MGMRLVLAGLQRREHKHENGHIDGGRREGEGGVSGCDVTLEGVAARRVTQRVPLPIKREEAVVKLHSEVVSL